ncbi:MAG: SIS domain-containing protein [Candidatus Hydrogenedentales bacterium]
MGRELLDAVEKTQAAAIRDAAVMIAESLMCGGVWHVFGTGHSHFLGEEVYYRAGGLAPVNAILFPALMQHEGPSHEHPKLERTPGLARNHPRQGGPAPGRGADHRLQQRQECRARGDGPLRPGTGA